MIKERINDLKKSNSFLAGLFRDIVFTLIVVLIFSTVSYIALGRFSPAVAVESESMFPHLKVGDLIFIESIDRSEIITNAEGARTGYSSFDYYGDVILYKRYGKDEFPPVIHRAMYYVETGDPLWKGGPASPYGGYITKGDNNGTNPVYDQQGSVSYLQPIKKEWVIGVARYRPIPLIGCVSLIIKGNFACFRQ